MPKQLPTFKGWTIDTRLKQLRKVGKDRQTIEFLDFTSEEGDKILAEFIESLDMTDPIDKLILQEIWS